MKAGAPTDAQPPRFQGEILEGLLRVAIENAADVVTISELSEDPERAGTVLYVNEAFISLFGYQKEEILGRTTEVLYGARTDLDAIRNVRRRLADGEHAQSEIALYRKDGSYVWTQDHSHPLPDAKGRIRHVVSIQRDVTDAMVRRLALATQNESLTKLTSIARNLFAAFDSRALVHSLLIGVQELTGGKGAVYAEVRGGGYASVEDLEAPDPSSPRAEPFIESAAGMEICVIDDAGFRVAVAVAGMKIQRVFCVSLEGIRQLTAVDVFTIGLLAQYFAVAARNVELYAELESRRAAVLELSSAKSDLITMLGHDFAGPLTSINGFAQLLLEQEGLDAESRGYAETIAKSAQRLSSLARDTLALARLEHNEIELTLEPFDLVELLRDIAASFSDLREVRVVAPEEELTIRADGARLRQVFENLIGNAIKYSPGSEYVYVAVRRRGERARVTVRDFGIGIPASDQGAIFSRFLRASNARRMGIAGTGFGLYLVKRLVERHGGSIVYASRPGRGSVFTVSLPVELPRGGAESRTQRLLLIDADSDARSFCAHAMRLAGYSVRTLTDIQMGFSALANEQYDIVVVDLDVYQSDRLLNPAEFRRLSPHPMRMIALCHPGQVTAEGWDIHLTKPFLAHDLQRAVEAALNGESDEQPKE